jgi:ribonuclease D
MEQVEALIQSADDLPALCAHLKQCRRFGMDTEFVGEESYHPSLCLIQIATTEKLYLVDPFTVGPLDALWDVIVDPANQVIVHTGREEVRLCHLCCGRSPENLFDLQIAAGLVGYSFPMGHGALVSQILGKSLSKGETLTEWRTRPLTPAQIRYAFDDVRYLLKIWEQLSGRLEKLGRADWAREEFARLRGLSTPTEEGLAPGTERWRKLRGAGSLDRQRLAIVRELYNWREQQAAQYNRPPRTLIRDDLLIEIARRNPRSESDLHHVRGLAKKFLPAVVEVVEKGRKVLPEDRPTPAERDMDPPQLGWMVSILSAALADFCARSQLASNLATSMFDLKMLVRTRMQASEPGESLLTQGWRAQFVLPHLEAILDGRRSLRIADPRGATPLAYDECPSQGAVKGT